MAVEQVTELQVFPEHIEAFVIVEPFELDRMDIAIHAGGQRLALGAAAAQIAPCEARGYADAGRGIRGQGRGLIRTGVEVALDPARVDTLRE